jgi:hypothetical protein
MLRTTTFLHLHPSSSIKGIEHQQAMNSTSRLGDLPAEIFNGILDYLPPNDLLSLSHTATGFHRYAGAVIDSQLSALDKDTATPLVKALVLTPPAHSSIATLRRICGSEKLREEMHSFQRKRVIDHTEHDEHDHIRIWMGQLRVLENLPFDDADHLAFFAAASGDAKLLALLAEAGWVPFNGTLFFAVLWELGYQNPFAPGYNGPLNIYVTKPVESPAERTPGVVDTILSMPAPPLLKQMMIAESIPMRVRPCLPWALQHSPSLLGVCSRQPPHCIAAARILRKILALRNVDRRFSGLGVSFA